MIETNNLDVLVIGLVDATDDRNHPGYVRGPVRNDQHIRARMRREVPVLRYQRTQDRHELRRADILHLDDLRDDIVTTRAARTHRAGILACRSIGDDLDQIPGRHRDITVHLQYRQESLIKGLGRHRGR